MRSATGGCMRGTLKAWLYYRRTSLNSPRALSRRPAHYLQRSAGVVLLLAWCVVRREAAGTLARVPAARPRWGLAGSAVFFYLSSIIRLVLQWVILLFPRLLAYSTTAAPCIRLQRSKSRSASWRYASQAKEVIHVLGAVRITSSAQREMYSCWSGE